MLSVMSVSRHGNNLNVFVGFDHSGIPSIVLNLTSEDPSESFCWDIKHRPVEMLQAMSGIRSMEHFKGTIQFIVDSTIIGSFMSCLRKGDYIYLCLGSKQYAGSSIRLRMTEFHKLYEVLDSLTRASNLTIVEGLVTQQMKAWTVSRHDKLRDLLRDKSAWEPPNVFIGSLVSEYSRPIKYGGVTEGYTTVTLISLPSGNLIACLGAFTTKDLEIWHIVSANGVEYFIENELLAEGFINNNE